MKRWVAFVVVGDAVTVVDTEVPDNPDEPLTIILDDTWKLQKGDRGSAYAVLHQRCTDYLRESRIDTVVVKASALSQGGTKLGLLSSAEVRGVVIAAASAVCSVKVITKALISRTYGERKVDEYVQDDDFWQKKLQGAALRKASREAAMLLVATRDK